MNGEAKTPTQNHMMAVILTVMLDAILPSINTDEVFGTHRRAQPNPSAFWVKGKTALSS